MFAMQHNLSILTVAHIVYISLIQYISYTSRMLPRAPLFGLISRAALTQEEDSALLLAAWKGNTGCFMELLERKASAEVKNKVGSRQCIVVGIYSTAALTYSTTHYIFKLSLGGTHKQ